MHACLKVADHGAHRLSLHPCSLDLIMYGVDAAEFFVNQLDSLFIVSHLPRHFGNFAMRFEHLLLLSLDLNFQQRNPFEVLG